jgi:hypothetical protein
MRREPESRAIIPARVPHLGSVTASDVSLAASGVKEPTEVTLSLLADGRTPFGEKFTVTLTPD